MKKSFKLLFALAFFTLCSIGLYSFTAEKTPHNTEITVPNHPVVDATAPAAGGSALFQTVTVTNSGSNKALAINCWFIDRANYYVETGDSTTLTLTKVKSGGDYRLLIKKTVSGVCTLTLTGAKVDATPISLSGAANSYFWVDFTGLPGSLIAWNKR